MMRAKYNLNAERVLLTTATVLLFVVVGANNAFASTATIKLSNITIPSGGSAVSGNFKVENRGPIGITVRLRTAHPAGLIGGGGTSRYIAELRRGTTVLTSQDRVVGNNFENVTLSYNVANCSQTGTYNIRVRNVTNVNPQQGEAAFPTFVVPSLTMVKGELQMFGVKQGNTIDRTIPAGWQPSGSGGKFRVWATWQGICLNDPNGCKLTFRLRRNGTVMKSSTGHSTLVIGGGTPTSTRMFIEYDVPANQVSGNWDLRVTGSEFADVNNVKTFVNFTPVCQ